MFRKGLLARLLLALGIAAGALTMAAAPASAGICAGAHQDGVGTYEVCVPI